MLHRAPSASRSNSLIAVAVSAVVFPGLLKEAWLIMNVITPELPCTADLIGKCRVAALGNDGADDPALVGCASR